MYERIGGFRVQRFHIPEGDRGSRATLSLMSQLAAQGARDLEVRDTAIEVVRHGARGHDYLGQLKALFFFVRDRIMFVRDVDGVETLQSPRKTLEVGAGDCDDRATLLVALARSIGIPVQLRFRVISPRPGRPFSHVYVVARFGRRELALDPTYGDNAPGWEYPNPARIGEVPA